MHSFTASKGRISKRVVASLVALAVAAPAAALASSTPARQGVVHSYVDRSGIVVVTGSDGGVALQPSIAAAKP
jgi:hypothetical protein